jgi:hypothetical protein
MEFEEQLEILMQMIKDLHKLWGPEVELATIIEKILPLLKK